MEVSLRFKAAQVLQKSNASSSKSETSSNQIAVEMVRVSTKHIVWLVVICSLVCSVAISLYTNRENQNLKQQEVLIQFLRANGGTIVFYPDGKGIKKLSIQNVELPPNFFNLIESESKLEYLDVSGCESNDFSEIRHLQNLKHLIVSNTTIGDRDVASILQFGAIEIVEIDRCANITDSMVQKLVNLRTIKRVTVSTNLHSMPAKNNQKVEFLIDPNSSSPGFVGE